MRVNVGFAKSHLSRLIAQVEAGEEVEIARDGTPVVRLVAIEDQRPAVRFRAAHGVLAGDIRFSEDFELTDAEIDELIDAP